MLAEVSAKAAEVTSSQESAIGKAEGTTSRCCGLPHSPNRHLQHLECRSKDENLPSQTEQDRMISWENTPPILPYSICITPKPQTSAKLCEGHESSLVVSPEEKDVALKLLGSLLILLMLK